MKRSLLLCISFIVLLTVPLLHAAEKVEPSGQATAWQEILILNSYHPGYAWSDDEQAGVVDVFRGKDKSWIPVIEYLDLKRLPDGRHLTELKQLFRRKYQNKKFSVVIAMDNPALEFAIDNQAELFRNAPIVFCGINNFTPSILKGHTDVTGIVEAIDIAGTIELMLRLHPATQEIFSPHDYTATGLAVRKELESLIPRFGKVRFHFTDPLIMEELLKEIEQLPKESLILEIGFITDKSGRAFDISETTKLFYEHSSVPIYSTYEQRLGFGIVGGKLLSPRIHGANAARIALRVLAGEKTSAIPVVFESDSKFMFDYKFMSRFGIPMSALPEGSMVINKPVSFYAIHRVVIQTALGITVFLTIIIFLLTINIIQRKRSSEVIRRSEELFKVITSSTPDHLIVQDSDLRYSFVMNPILGLTEQDIIGKTDHDFLSKEDADKLTEIKRQVVKTGHAVHVEVPLTSSTGGQQYFDGSYIPKFDAKGQADGLIGYFRNVTIHKRAEDSLVQAAREWQETFDASNDIIWLLDQEQRVLRSNKAAELFFHRSIDEIIGKNCWEIIHGTTQPIPECPILRARKSLSRETMELQVGESWFTVTVDPILDLAGQYSGAVHIISDITERKQAEDKILASLREKDILISEIHHRVKNNLQVMSGLLKLQERASKNPEAIEGFRESQDRIRSMAMIHEKLYSSEDFTKIDLADYMRSLSQELFISHNIHPGKIDLTMEISEDIILDVSKAIPCALVINELISNALKHAFPGDGPGKLQIIICETESKELEIIVRDNGVGIPDDVDIQETESVGLYLVNGLVKNQIHGQVEVKRDNGTEFRITIPL